MADKLPALQFYPGDWRKDPGIQALDYETRGIWFEVLLLMHESEERGRLLLNGRPMPDPAVARILGIPEADWKQARSRLLAYGVASEDDDGALVNRRMVRDEALRQKKIEAGRKGGKKSRPPKRKKASASGNGSVGEAKSKHEGGSSSSVSSSTTVEDPSEVAEPSGDASPSSSDPPSDAEAEASEPSARVENSADDDPDAIRDIAGEAEREKAYLARFMPMLRAENYATNGGAGKTQGSIVKARGRQRYPPDAFEREIRGLRILCDKGALSGMGLDPGDELGLRPIYAEGDDPTERTALQREAETAYWQQQKETRPNGPQRIRVGVHNG